jgi:predicted PurR-regulated permease PerM
MTHEQTHEQTHEYDGQRRPGSVNGRTTTIPGNSGSSDAHDWKRLRDMGVAALAWIGVAGVALWVLAHIIGSLLIFVLAAILAYALSPAARHLERFMPRGFAIALVYIGILSTLSGLLYLIVITAVSQVSMLLKDVTGLLTPAPGADSPLVDALKGFGLTDDQIKALGDRILHLGSGVTGDPVSLAASVIDTIVRTVLIGVLSIYLINDGPRIVRWLRSGTPIGHRARINFFVDTLDRVVGGYIRGQLILAALIGLLVGIGMWVLHVPYAVFLGVLAFVLEFVPILGVFISGAICVVIALTVGWFTALAVLAYFVLVHFVEGDIVGPRLMGHAVGLHPAISIIALFAGSELFGIWGALFASPVAGLLQAMITAIWIQWRQAHPEQFPTGYTVASDVAIVPVVTTAESPPAPAAEPAAAPISAAEAPSAQPVYPEPPDEAETLPRALPERLPVVPASVTADGDDGERWESHTGAWVAFLDGAQDVQESSERKAQDTDGGEAGSGGEAEPAPATMDADHTDTDQKAATPCANGAHAEPTEPPGTEPETAPSALLGANSGATLETIAATVEDEERHGA